MFPTLGGVTLPRRLRKEISCRVVSVERGIRKGEVQGDPHNLYLGMRQRAREDHGPNDTNQLSKMHGRPFRFEEARCLNDFGGSARRITEKS